MKHWKFSYQLLMQGYTYQLMVHLEGFSSEFVLNLFEKSKM